MAKYEHSLQVLFNTSNTEVIYDGIIYSKKNLIDNVTISCDSIVITFVRSSKKKKEAVLDSPSSIIREHLQKALCFYLVTQGTIPEVKDIIFTCGKERMSLPHEHFTCCWKNCDIDITLPAEKAEIIFRHAANSEEKIFYVVITHFLKSQLDNFSHDRFRAAWSTLNAMYTYIDALSNSGYRSEEKKISTLSEIIDKNDMCNATKLINSLEINGFWGSLSWYSIFNGLSEKEMRKYFNGSSYNDSELLNFIYKYMSGIQHIEEKYPELKKEFTAKISRSNVHRPSDKLKFIVCKYCYNKRNNSYHAVEPYPVFVISETAETNIEQTLTEIIQLTVKDLFIIYSEKLEQS